MHLLKIEAKELVEIRHKIGSPFRIEGNYFSIRNNAPLWQWKTMKWTIAAAHVVLDVDFLTSTGLNAIFSYHAAVVIGHDVWI